MKIYEITNSYMKTLSDQDNFESNVKYIAQKLNDHFDDLDIEMVTLDISTIKQFAIQIYVSESVGFGYEKLIQLSIIKALALALNKNGQRISFIFPDLEKAKSSSKLKIVQ